MLKGWYVMSCWVVPAVAAEYFGCSIEEVHARMAGGGWPTKFEHGFALIDLVPHSPRLELMREPPAEEPAADPMPALPESALPRTPDGKIDVEQIEFDYYTARVATAKLRRPPGH